MDDLLEGTTIDYRGRLHTLMRETLADERRYHDWTYYATRPRYMPHRPWYTDERVVGDCSKGVQFLCWWAAVPSDPMGMHYGPYGNSATLAAHLPHALHAYQLDIGDIITFGLWGNDHAAMVLERGSDPVLWSFGHPGAPNTYHLSYDKRVHQYLRLLLPATPLTPEERLRAMTGYWSWLQWRLGEGHWRHYPPMGKHVRPHVPVVIPPAWWRNYRRFIHQRHVGNKLNPATPAGDSVPGGST
jgi:hypothetical protein